MNECMFNDTPARKTDRLLGVSVKTECGKSSGEHGVGTSVMFSSSSLAKNELQNEIYFEHGRKDGSGLFNDTLNTFSYGYMASDVW